jgi:hypothetical protein
MTALPLLQRVSIRALLASACALIALSASAQCGGGGGGGGDCAGGGYCPPECMSCGPQMYLTINMAGSAWHLTGLDDPVAFGTSHRMLSGWTARDAEIAFLAIDGNANGVIDDGTELFGNLTPLANGEVARDGFAALAQYDTNGDGIIDQRDTVWTSLLLWVDRNHDGISQPDELVPITASPITAIELWHRWSGRRDPSGNYFRYESAVHLGDSVRSFFDISFSTRR